MWTKLHNPWGGPRTWTSSASERHRVGDAENFVPLPKGMSTNEGTGLIEPRYIDIHQGAASSVKFLPDGKHIVTGGEDGTVRRWRLEEGSDRASEVGKPIHSVRGMNAAVVSKDGKWIILVGIEGRSITVWDAMTHERVVESVEAHEQRITALDVSPDASRIASGSLDGTVILWCLETGKRLACPLKQGQSVLSVQFSPAGDRLASAGWDYSIRVWDILGDADQVVTSCIPTNPAYSLAWSNDGRRLFAGCFGGSILCFNFSSSTPTTAVPWPDHPHVDSISTLRLSHNGKFIISASSSECFVKIWDVHTRSEIGSLQHAGEVLDVEISPDDSHLVCGVKDGKFPVWNLRKVLPMTYFFHSLTTFPTFPSRSVLHPILTDVSNAAYISWRKAELVRAEEILSCEIGRGSDPLHYHLANRALVRARLRQWVGALDDAQASLSVKLSLVALLAKSVAQSGQKLYNAAVETLNIALENCGQAEKGFVNVIKAIIIFDAGFRDDALRHVNDLVDHSPDVKHPCAFVQAKMYALLAADAMDSQEYIRAIPLFAQARDLCPPDQYPEMDTISLVSGWVFDGLRLGIYQQSCEACYAARHTQLVLDTVGEMESAFGDEMKLRSELKGWLTGFTSRCVEMLETQGDGAMYNKNYDNAITQYTAALDINPVPLLAGTLFVKRSEARAALRLWKDALQDADEAVSLNRSSPWGYERRHAALHKLERYEDAINALTTMISILENSPDPMVRLLRGNYINPTDTKEAILKVFKDSADNSPFRLIDTTSGRLCDAEKRRQIFEEDPIFQELISSMTTQLDQERINTITRQYFQYVMLSHRWERKELELADVLDKSIYEPDTSPALTKLQRFCHLARNANFRWAWSDTCCINKDKDVEFEKSINSMFGWYRCSAATIVYLTGVPPRVIPGALKRSVWMTRGWTLQELLAPPVIRFYYEDWTPYLNNTFHNHKESADIMKELEDATNVTAHDLLAFHPGPQDIRVKLRLASTRETTIPVDMAYGLFGIFGLTMPVIHGESQQHALGRLFQEIVARSGDIACLSWVGQSSEFNSAFPDHIRVYRRASCTVPHLGEEDMERQVVDLRHTWTRKQEAEAIRFYQRLTSLPPARCTNQHLFLPCIVFPLTMLKKAKRTDGVRVYRATTRALEDVDISTEDRLPPKGQGPEDLVLVCPWIHELLDTTPPCRARPRASVEAESSGSDSETESEAEHDTSTRELALDLHSANPASGSLQDSGARSPHASDQLDAAMRVLRMLVRFRQPLGAFLLLSQGHGQYRRVATDHDIIIRVRNEVSLDDMILRTLEIL